MKSKTIILSIHPRHVEKILSGEKRYEYRKQIPTDIDYNEIEFYRDILDNLANKKIVTYDKMYDISYALSGKKSY